ncbi:MAG: 4Fe-4S dicluster domain-containing protein [Sedimentisphaerales bacterium]|nr:4Fe-4S dicluster domain-containing protein [Sedimentisphaerales bacterium]
MRWPKLRELKEAVVAVISPRFTTRFPAKPCQVPERYRGKPEFDEKECIGCGACVNVCPTQSLMMIDDLEANPPVRKIIQRYDSCIFCGNCQENCTTQKGIKLSDKWDLATLDRETTKEIHEHELQICEKCGAIVGVKKHLAWIYERLGPLAYTNPSLVIAQSENLTSQKKISELTQQAKQTQETKAEAVAGDFMKILCPSCKYELNIRL